MDKSVIHIIAGAALHCKCLGENVGYFGGFTLSRQAKSSIAFGDGLEKSHIRHKKVTKRQKYADYKQKENFEWDLNWLEHMTIAGKRKRRNHGGKTFKTLSFRAQTVDKTLAGS